MPAFSKKLMAALAISTLSLLGACSATNGSSSNSSGSDNVRFGVSGPITGPSAEYGTYWREGFDLALQEINADGGINGVPLELVWEDSQSDPKQSVPIAQKFVADKTIVTELGDFSSPASMAASATYQQAGMVQFGFTNSAAGFTQGGDHMWSSILTQAYYQTKAAELVKQHSDKVSVVYLQSDWGKSSFDAFKQEAERIGLDIAYESAIQADSEDYRPVLIKARDAQPDAIVHIGYAPDGARVVRQLRELGWDKEFFGGQSTPQFIEAAGNAAEGTIISENLLIGNDSATVTQLYQKFRDAYGHDPSVFSVYAYDALRILAQAAERGGTTREGVFRGLNEGGSFTSAQFGEFTFGEDRRPNNVPLLPLVVRNGAYEKLT